MCECPTIEAVNGDDLFEAADQHLRSMQVPEALRSFDLAEQANCDADSCAAGRWICHMLSGNYEQAWLESDRITSRGNPDPYRFWDGRPVDGRRVLVRCIHGLGDTIQFIRYASLIRHRALTLTIEAQPALRSLLAASSLADHVITWGDAEPEWDQQIEVVELPRVFRTTLESIPTDIPYLHVPAPAPSSPNSASGPLRIGIVWASGPYNPARSLRLADLAALFENPRVSFFSLQAGDERAELASWAGQVTSLYDESGCVLAAAKTLLTLDLVITVDTMMAHLAGAMGRPVWTLLPFECDWRWMLNRADSPWYPTMRLFRQPRPGDWATVIQEVRRALGILRV